MKSTPQNFGFGLDKCDDLLKLIFCMYGAGGGGGTRTDLVRKSLVLHELCTRSNDNELEYCFKFFLMSLHQNQIIKS